MLLILSIQLIVTHFSFFLFLFVGLQVLIDAREKLDIPWEHSSTSPTLANQLMQLTGLSSLSVDQFAKYCPTISLVWQDRAIKKAYDRRREFQIVRIQRTMLIALNAGDN